LAWLAALLAMFSFLMAVKFAAPRRQYAYAGLAFFLMAAALLAGCSSGSSSGGGGGTTRSITANYSGDTNYSASKSSAITITIQ